MRVDDGVVPEFHFIIFQSLWNKGVLDDNNDSCQGERVACGHPMTHSNLWHRAAYMCSCIKSKPVTRKQACTYFCIASCVFNICRSQRMAESYQGPWNAYLRLPQIPSRFPVYAFEVTVCAYACAHAPTHPPLHILLQTCMKEAYILLPKPVLSPHVVELQILPNTILGIFIFFAFKHHAW